MSSRARCISAGVQVCSSALASHGQRLNSAEYIAFRERCVLVAWWVLAPLMMANVEFTVSGAAAGCVPSAGRWSAAPVPPAVW